jgi:hypothetical protein
MEIENPMVEGHREVVSGDQEISFPQEHSESEKPTTESSLVSALKGSRTNIISGPRTVSFFIDGVILLKENDDESSDDEGPPAVSAGPNPANLHLGSTATNAQSWYFQLCNDFTVEAACQSLNLQHREILFGGIILLLLPN